jgi:serine/threonine protein kinase
MPLLPGSKIGAYEIVALLGAGGMGEVYRARDARLNRDVAIKIINAHYETDPEGVRRFELEARALAALNHPNLLAIYDIGNHEDRPYIVSELLEGENLRTRLGQGPVPLRRAIEFATQVVRALVAAHDKGLIHRDLKPENIYLTKDGQIKLLDFGLAKLIQHQAAVGSAMGGSTITVDTGKALGTPGYMSPEQLRAQTVDYRTDIFSFGAVLHEMLCGKRAFTGGTSADIVSATLNSEPSDLCESNPSIPASTAVIIRHCLEKRPDDRFQSARDLLFDLQSLAVSSGSGSTLARRETEERKFKQRLLLWWIPAGIIIAVAGFFASRLLRPAVPALPSFTQVTFRRSSIWYARFTSDGMTVLYNASWAERPLDILSIRLGSTESRSLGLTNADLLSVSSKGELAILEKQQDVDPDAWANRAMLARVPMGGGSPREIVEDVQSADWAPDGVNLAIVRHVKRLQQLEYPIGKVLFRTEGWITDIRVSPRGDMVAFMDHPTRWDDRGWVSVADVNGTVRRLTEEYSSERGLAWWPDGKSIWFTATVSGEPAVLYSVSLTGESTTRFRAPIRLELHDIAPDGSALISSYKDLTSLVALRPGDQNEQDLSWLDQVFLSDLSADGKTFLFQYIGQGSGPNYSSYLGKTDGSPPVRLGEGAAVALSPDGKWAITILYQNHRTILLPTGAGQTRSLERPGITNTSDDTWTPDSQHVLFTGTETGHEPRCYVQDINGGASKPLCPEGVTDARMSPDGKLLLAREPGGYVLLQSGGTDKRPAKGLDPEDHVIRWSADAKSLYVYHSQRPIELFKVDPATGHRQLLRRINSSDPAGIIGFPRLFVSTDGEWIVYSFTRRISELYVARDLQ